MENKINADDLVKNQDIDASHWAAAFMQLFGSDLRRIDEGLMSSWFANSIMVTHDKISNEKDVAVEQLKFENEQLKKLMSVQIDMLEQNKKLTRTLELENMASAQLIAEIEQLKAELRTSDLNRQSLWADSVKMADELNYIKAKHTAEITALKSKLAKAKENLNTALNYLHWREDDLIGDDLIGDGRLTAEYKNKVSEIEKSILEIGEG